jgi:hypothetical protein
MEEIITSRDIKYSATFDPYTGQIKSVGPSFAFLDKKYVIEIERDIAESIIVGIDHMSNYVVDVRSNKIELREKKNLITIDDLLHRIVEKKWSQEDYFDIFLTYQRKKNILKIQMTEEFYGTKKLPKKYKNLKKRDVIWEGTTDLFFYIADYNDPNAMYDYRQIKILDLIGNTIEFPDIKFPEKFSIYTRRIFNNYVIEIK